MALEHAAHVEDWPEQPTRLPARRLATLPRAVWDRALGDVARDILGRPSRQFRARMCELGWRLADGPGEVARALPALVEIVHAGSLIVDDIEDGSKLRRGAAAVHLVHGVPRTLNAGTWMYFWALDLVDRLPLPRATRRRIRDALGQALHRGHLGQALDLSVSIGRMPRALIYRTVATSTMLKTGALMELAARHRRAGRGRVRRYHRGAGPVRPPDGPRPADARRFRQPHGADPRGERHEGAGGPAQRPADLALGARGAGPGRRRIFGAASRAPVRSANAETPTARGPARWRRSCGWPSE